MDLWVEAREAETALGAAPAWITPTEHDLRVFIHDVLEVHHDKDFRTFAALPLSELQEVALFVMRIDHWDAVKLEVIVGSDYSALKPRNLWTLIHKKHTRAMRPPPALSGKPW